MTELLPVADAGLKPNGITKPDELDASEVDWLLELLITVVLLVKVPPNTKGLSATPENVKPPVGAILNAESALADAELLTVTVAPGLGVSHAAHVVLSAPFRT